MSGFRNLEFVAHLSGFPGGTVVKNPSANAEDTGDVVSVLGGEDVLEEKVTTHCNILAWEIT